MEMKKMNIETSICLASGIRLRQEYFGGLVYDSRNGNTLEVDKDVFQFLDSLKDKVLKIKDAIELNFQNKTTKKTDNSLDKILKKLFELRIIEKNSESQVSRNLLNCNTDHRISHKSWLSAPETIHWAVTYRCDENCPDCYASRFSYIRHELNTKESLTLINKIADWNVFQLAIGGGEPFMRRDLPLLASHATGRGLSVHITTGKLDIDSHLLESLCPSIKSLNLGIRPDDLIASHSRKSIQQIQKLVASIRKFGIIPGTNLFLSKTVIKHLDQLIEILIKIGFNRINLLRYKPPKNIERWKAENPNLEQLKKLHERIRSIVEDNPQLNIRIDCGLSFVQRYLPKKTTARLGIKGCVAGDRILALAPDGSAYPCSQLVHPDCCAGNLYETEPELLWDQSHVLRKYRSFRDKKSFRYSWCGICRAKYQCGGCRVFAMDGLGGDPGCPEPLVPSLTQLGKIGRKLDLSEYLKSYGSIHVREYMNRYGVNQKKAIRELNSSHYAVRITEKSRRKKRDIYKCNQEDVILDIQEMIGTTSGGFPFVSYEEISEWIDSKNYPEWIAITGGRDEDI